MQMPRGNQKWCAVSSPFLLRNGHRHIASPSANCVVEKARKQAQFDINMSVPTVLAVEIFLHIA